MLEPIFQKCSQLAITCLKLPIEALEQVKRYCQSKQEKHQNDAIGVALISLLLNLNIFHTLF